MSISDPLDKIKQFTESQEGKDILTVVIVILVALSSFGLGRLSKSDQGSGIKIEYNEEPANVISAAETLPNSVSGNSTTTSSKNFFASSRGSKYYPLGCSAGKSLKMENRIYFATREEAEGAGYSLSSSCK